MNNQKLTLDKFNLIKNSLKKLFKLIEEKLVSNKEESKNLINQYLLIQKELLSYNLSNISKKEWEDLYILPNNIFDVTFDEKPAELIDFSKTFANIDFNYFFADPNCNYNFKNCEIDNIYLNLENIEWFDNKILNDDYIKNIYENSKNIDEILEFNKRFPIKNYNLEKINIKEIIKTNYQNTYNLDKLFKLIDISNYLSIDDLKEISKYDIDIVKYLNSNYKKIYSFEKINYDLKSKSILNMSLLQFLEKGEKQYILDNNYDSMCMYVSKAINDDVKIQKLQWLTTYDGLDIKKFFNKLDVTNFILSSPYNPNKFFWLKNIFGKDLKNYVDIEKFKIALNNSLLFDKNFIIVSVSFDFNINDYFDINNYLDYNTIKKIFNNSNDESKKCLVEKLVKIKSIKEVYQLDEDYKKIMLEYPEVCFNLKESDYGEKITNIFDINEIYNHFINLLEKEDFQGIAKLNLFIDIVIDEKIENRIEQIVKNSSTYKIAIELYLILNYEKYVDKNVKKIIEIYNSLDSESVKNSFKLYWINKPKEEVNIDDITKSVQLIKRIENSNSNEIRHISDNVIEAVLKTDDPYRQFQKIENIFLDDSIPYVGKIYMTFNMLYSNINKIFEIENNKKISPTISKKNNFQNQVLIFSDLLRISAGSNNKSLKKYLENIKNSNDLFLLIGSGSVNYESLNENDKKKLNTYVKQLNALYENTLRGKTTNYEYKSIEENINKLLLNFSENGKFDYNLPDRIVKMFGHFAGFNTFDDLYNYINEKVEYANKRNIDRANKKDFKLEEGDFVKGFQIEYIENILNNGSVAKEFLGESSRSDLTPLDTDVLIVTSDKKDVTDTLAKRYGKDFIVLKNDNRFSVTRKSPIEKNQEIDYCVDSNKLEAFYTGVIGKEHYGIRTGFASSEIDYFVTEDYNPQFGFNIAKNGFYIPVVDINNNLIFTVDKYNEIRSKMQGLSEYNLNNYNFSNNLIFDDVLEIKNKLDENYTNTVKKGNIVKDIIKNAIIDASNELGMSLNVKTKEENDLTEGVVYIIDTGSTGRGTNSINSGDFDFIIRLDRNILNDENKLNIIKKAIKSKCISIEKQKSELKYEGVILEGYNEPVDIDITFLQKVDNIEYSTNICIQDRLFNMKKKDLEKTNLAIANIIYAKQYLKEASVYKKGSTGQGGLGGVGIENWILQNGGSFYDAAIDFLNHAQNRNFEEFKKVYQVWDFGKNHVDLKNDNFVLNITADGYTKMCNALKKFLNEYDNKRNIDINQNNPERHI